MITEVTTDVDRIADQLEDHLDYRVWAFAADGPDAREYDAPGRIAAAMIAVSLWRRGHRIVHVVDVRNPCPMPVLKWEDYGRAEISSCHAINGGTVFTARAAKADTWEIDRVKHALRDQLRREHAGKRVSDGTVTYPYMSHDALVTVTVWDD